MRYLVAFILFVLSCGTVRAETSVAFWPLDQDARDLSGQRYHGTEVGGVSWLREGNVGFARFRADQKQYIDLSAHLPAFRTLARGTLSAWIRVKVPEKAVVFSMTDSHEEQMGLALFTEWGLAGFEVRNGKALNEASASRFVANGEWRHLLVSHDGERTFYFVDGYGVTPPDGPDFFSGLFFSSVPGADEMALGRSGNSGDPEGGQWFFDGDLARVRVLDRPVVSSEDVVRTFASDYDYFSRPLPRVRPGKYSGNSYRMDDVAVFDTSKETGGVCFRIPAIIGVPDGNGKETLVAFSEWRQAKNCSDHGLISIVARTSRDGGATWGRLFTVVSPDVAQKTPGGGGYAIAGNPAPFVFRNPGDDRPQVGLLFNTSTFSEEEINRNPDARRYVWFQEFSVKNGELVALTDPEDVTSQTVDPAWNAWIAMTPGHAVTLPDGTVAIPGNHFEMDEKQYYPHIVYFDPVSRRWTFDGKMDRDALRGGNESTAAVFDNRLVVSIRNQGKNGVFPWSRFIATAPLPKGGSPLPGTWQGSQDVETVDPIIQGSLLDFGDTRTSRLVFVNAQYATRRIRLTAKMARSLDDQGRPVWSDHQRVIHPGASSYADLVSVHHDGGPFIGVLYERDTTKEGIYFTKFNLEWLTDGEDRYDPGQAVPAGR